MAHPDDSELINELVSARDANDDTRLNAACWALALHHEPGIRRVAPPYRSWCREQREDHHQDCLIYAAQVLRRYDPTVGASVLTFLRHQLASKAGQLHGRAGPVTVGRDAARTRGWIAALIDEGVTSVDELAVGLAARRDRARGIEPRELAASGLASWRRTVIELLPTINPAALDATIDDAGTVTVGDVCDLRSDDPADLVCAWVDVGEAVEAAAVETVPAAEVARMLGVTRQAVASRIASGALRVHRRPGDKPDVVWVRADDVERWRHVREGTQLSLAI